MNKYEDIINLEHHVSEKHPQMSREARAAQFTPFAALTGYDTAIKETARLTDKKIEIDEGLKTVLNNRLQIILQHIKSNPEISFTYFLQDNKKQGGKYITTEGKVKKIDITNGYITLNDKTKIIINDIINITGSIFKLNFTKHNVK